MFNEQFGFLSSIANVCMSPNPPGIACLRNPSNIRPPEVPPLLINHAFSFHLHEKDNTFFYPLSLLHSYPTVFLSFSSCFFNTVFISIYHRQWRIPWENLSSKFKHRLNLLNTMSISFFFKFLKRLNSSFLHAIIGNYFRA